MVKIKISLFESVRKDQIVPSNENRSDIDDTQSLDPSASSIIQLPKSVHPDRGNATRWPEGFWDHVNGGSRHYANGKYVKAREEFLKARELKQDYQFLNSQLLRVLRKLYKQSIEKGKWADAYGFLAELFNVIPDLATDSDRKQFNKVITTLKSMEPEFSANPLELLGKTTVKADVPLINMEAGPNTRFKVRLENTITPQLPDKKPIYWHKGCFTSNGTVFYRRIYNQNPADTIYHLRTYSDTGVALLDQEFPHDFCGIKIAQSGDWLIGYTEDLHLFLYSMKGQRLSERTILRIEANNKSHIRCVDISANGKYALFTAATRLFLLDENLRTLHTWRTPPPEGYRLERPAPDNTSQEVRNAISILELSDVPSKEEIKTNFRRLIQVHHPDKNPGDNKAEEKTKSLIRAYKSLTDEDPIQALKGLKDVEVYLKTINEYNIEFKELGVSYKVTMSMSGPGDWIYASYVTQTAERIYLGTYSGHVYCIDREGRVLKTFIADDVIREIVEFSTYLYITTDYGLYIIQNDKLVRQIEMRDAEINSFAEWGFIIKYDSSIALYELNGELIAKIRLSSDPYEVLPKKQGLIVRTKKIGYDFLFSI